MAESAPAPGENEIAHEDNMKVSQVERVMMGKSGGQDALESPGLESPGLRALGRGRYSGGAPVAAPMVGV